MKIWICLLLVGVVVADLSNSDDESASAVEDTLPIFSSDSNEEEATESSEAESSEFSSDDEDDSDFLPDDPNSTLNPDGKHVDAETAKKEVDEVFYGYVDNIDEIFGGILGGGKSTKCLRKRGVCMSTTKCKSLGWKQRRKTKGKCRSHGKQDDGKKATCCDPKVGMGPKKCPALKKDCTAPVFTKAMFENAYLEKGLPAKPEEGATKCSKPKSTLPDLALIWSEDKEFIKAKHSIMGYLKCMCGMTTEDLKKAHTYLRLQWLIHGTYVANRMGGSLYKRKVKRYRKRYGKKPSQCKSQEMRYEAHKALMPRLKRGWFITMLNNYRFKYEMGYFKRNSMSKRPSTYEKRYCTKEVGGAYNMGGVAASTVKFVRAVKKSYGGRVKFGTYSGHSWGPYSLDAFLGGANEQGFYKQSRVISFMAACEKARLKTGIKYRALYDDFEVAKAVNKAAKRRVMGFVPYHGPAPFVLHLHIDVMPASPATSLSPAPKPDKGGKKCPKD